MPITVLIPPEAGSPHPSGPGFVVQWEFVGPIPAGWSWNVRILDDVNDTLSVSETVFPATGSPATLVIGEPLTTSTVASAKYQVPHGSPAILQVRLFDDLQTLREIGNRAITYDAVTGVPHLQAIAASSTTGGGYTQTDRTVAQNTLNAVQATFPGLGGLPGVVLDIGRLFTTPPVEILRRAELLILTGRGVLQYPAGGVDVQAYGAYIELLTPPAGAGFDEGVVQEFETRVAQFAVLGRHGSTLSYLKNLYDLINGGQYLTWGTPFPRQIQYDITPGFQVGWRWLVLGVQP